MTRAIAQTYNIANEYRSFISRSLITLCLVAALFYAANIYLVISRAMAANAVKKQTAVVSLAVKDLDGKYIALSGKITPDAASAYGLHEGTVSAFISRTVLLGRAGYAYGLNL